MSNKPQATFKRLIGWDTSYNRIHAFLGEVNHPSLGTQPSVTTSRVLHIGYDEQGNVNELETRNTLYTRE